MMQLSRLISTFAVNLVLLIAGYIMYSDGSRALTNPVWASMFTIATAMTIVIWLVWNFDDIVQMLRHNRQENARNQKREYAQEVAELRRRLQRLENENSLHMANENLRLKNEDWVILDDAQITKKIKGNY